MKQRCSIKKRRLSIIITGIVWLFFAYAGHAEEEKKNALMAGDKKSDVYVLEDITVTGKLIRPTKQTGDSLYTGTSVTKKGIELMGTPAKTSVYNVLDIIQGLNVESKDPYGLSGTDIRIRGAKGYYIGMTVEGIPNYGIMPIGAREDIYDMENMESVSLYKGASPADLGTGSGNRGGSIELQLRRPENKAGIELGQSFGSKDFVRTFLRIDSGELPTKTKFFGSYSYTDADKWKGKGDLGGRDHVTLGLNQQFGDAVNIDLFYNFNESERHFLKNLSYEQADHINRDDNFYHHYNNELTSDPKKDINYYDYNRGKFINRDFMSIIDINISEKFNLSLKPYYSSEDANFWEGRKGFPVMGYTQPKKPGVLKKIRELERYGVIPEINFDISGFGITAGYWFESHDLEKYVKRYVTTPSGLEYNGYMYYAKNDGHGEIHSPYAKVSYELNKFKFQAGLKYFYYEEPASTGYTSDAALNLKEDPDISLKETDYDEVLPTLGIGYEFTENTRMYFNYGRNYMRPYAYVPTTNLYAMKKKLFKKANMTLQDIFDDWEMETSDNFDLSFRYSHKYFSIAPVFFYSKHNDLLASIDDPRIIKNNKPVAYYQNVGDATSYGFELELNFYPSKNLIVYFNPSYTDMSFDDDFKRDDNILKIEDNQIPDTPEWIVKSGLIYTINNFEISPTVKWIGSRYGDALNKERIDDYAVVDLNFGYRIDDFGGLREAKVGLELSNLFDERYVGAIEASDTGTGADYFAGSPFTAIFTVSGKF
ncbi:iron complex outermembrane recepter protein [Desulfosarcina sp. BuS5]|uniref:TonB-dependent receptor n=1 Tax=Desulfosarcina sp. BuS5 TaxID=933262 RepID=UPI0006861F46|nr:TonB-dependent receptor [Desulfosarcina sp. BuS5]WDN88713.1 iron complex outermembrane recepter protein [Desulfosarcina sp. BuS5]